MDLLRVGTAPSQVSNLVGTTEWSDVPAVVQPADLVICNNSAIAHQAASLGVRTLAIYSASHQPLEWGPRGSRSRAIMMDVQCSPCGWERIEECNNDHRCMQMITPELVLVQVTQMLAGEGP
jgi:ADP-heptose:LPS heptosyltransferase